MDVQFGLGDKVINHFLRGQTNSPTIAWVSAHKNDASRTEVDVSPFGHNYTRVAAALNVPSHVGTQSFTSNSGLIQIIMPSNLNPNPADIAWVGLWDDQFAGTLYSLCPSVAFEREAIATAGTNIIATESAHGLSNDDPVTVDSIDGVLPGGFTVGTTYYANSTGGPTGTTFKLGTATGGVGTVTISSSGGIVFRKLSFVHLFAGDVLQIPAGGLQVTF